MKKTRKEQEIIVTKDYTYHILAALIAIAAIFRIYHLDYNSIWLDEAATYFHSLTLSSIFDYTNSVDYFNPPLFFLFEFIMIQIAGASEIGLRFFPALFGILTIPAAYFMGKEFKDKYTGILVAGIFTFSPFLIFYSQEARAFSLLLLTSTLLMYIFLKAMKTNTILDWVWFGLLSTVVFCTHFYGAIFIVLLAVFAIASYYKNIKHLLYGIAAGLFSASPLIILTVWLYFQRISSGAPTYGLQGLDVITVTITQLTGFLGGYIAMIFLLLSALGVLWLVFKDSIKAYLILWITIPTIIISLIMSSHIPILPRYMIFLMIPLALAIASLYQPISNLTSGGTKHLQLCLVFLVIFALLGVPFYQTYYTQYYKEDWRGISDDLKINAVAGDVIVPLPSYIDMPFKLYYNASKQGTTIYKATNLSELINSTNPDPTKSTYYIITYDIVAADPSLEMLKWVGSFPINSKYGNIVVVKR